MKVLISPIKSEDDLQSTLKRIDQIIDSLPGTPERAELEILSVLVRDYEERNHKIDTPVDLLLRSAENSSEEQLNS